MMALKRRRHYGRAAIAFGLAATTVYMGMIYGTLAHIEGIAQRAPFDMRPMGYSAQDATELLYALGEDGRWNYLTRQIPLDMIYPALLGLTLISALLWFEQRAPHSKLTRIGIGFSLGAVLFDYAENLGVVLMIQSWSDLQGALVYAAGLATISKSCLTAVAAGIVIGRGAHWTYRWATRLHP